MFGYILFFIGVVIFLLSFVLWLYHIIKGNMGKMFKWLIMLNIGNIFVQIGILLIKLK